MEIHFNVWLDHQGKAFGEECFLLLEAVETTGSLNKAAAEVNLSYGGVLRVLRRSEERLGFALLERRIGGSSGGGSRLTPEAMDLMARYRLFTEELLRATRHIYKEHVDLDERSIH